MDVSHWLMRFATIRVINLIIIIIIIIIIWHPVEFFLIINGMEYQKAFDRVPQSWIIKSLELNDINNKVVSLTKEVMSYWRTRMRLHTKNKLIETDDIKIKYGIFQGDSLSPLFLHFLNPSY